MYTLSLNRVPENGTHQERDVRLTLADLELGEPFDPSGVTLNFQFQRIFDKVFGWIHAEAAATLTCGHCLTEFKAPIRADFSVQFEPRAAAAKRQQEKDEDGDDEDPGFAMAFYDGESLPVGEELRQELELQLPYAPLCRPDCKGLCPRCGQDLNQGPCACPKTAEGGAFSDLNQLLHNKRKQP